MPQTSWAWQTVINGEISTLPSVVLLPASTAQNICFLTGVQSNYPITKVWPFAIITSSRTITKQHFAVQSYLFSWKIRRRSEFHLTVVWSYECVTGKKVDVLVLTEWIFFATFISGWKHRTLWAETPLDKVDHYEAKKERIRISYKKGK